MSLPKVSAQGIIAQEVNLSSNSATPVHELGTRVRDMAGNEYVYIRNGIDNQTDLARGEVVMQEGATSVDTVSSSADLLSVTEAAAGWDAGQWSGFLMHVNDGTGEGQVRRVIGNNATTLFLEDELDTALNVADSDIELFNPFVVNVATANGQIIPIGIAIIVITATYYGWVQSSGIAEVNAGGACAANLAVKVGDDTAGSVVVVADGNDLFDVNIIGHTLIANTNADTAVPVKLNIR